jgi:hypothetical protein
MIFRPIGIGRIGMPILPKDGATLACESECFLFTFRHSNESLLFTTRMKLQNTL